MSKELSDKEISAGARWLCDQSADACGVNREDNWNIYGNEYIHEFRGAYNAAVKVSPATANKAAEEGELPAIPEELSRYYGYYGWQDYVGLIHGYVQLAIAADRASRQVANKAEDEPASREVLELALHALKKAPELRALGFNELHVSDCKDGIDSTGCTVNDYAKAANDIHAVIEKARDAVRALLATPAATTGASTARSIDTIDFHNLLRICMKHGDDYPTHSARLIDYINRHFAGSIGASTVLTDERIERFECLDLFEQWAADNGHEIDSRVAWANDRNSAGFLMWVGWQAAVRTISSTLKSEVASKASRVVAPFGYAEPACIEEIMKTENKKAGAYIRVYAAPFEGLAGEHRPTVAVYAPSPAKESK